MKQRTMDSLLLLGSIIMLAAMLTWVLPAGGSGFGEDLERHLAPEPRIARTVDFPHPSA
jgi:uncharacterized ion transporter superfamily protein YfcC